MKTPRKAQIQFSVSVEQDDMPVRGNAMSSGDDEADRACEDEILARLDDGDVWAWASVKVTARLDIEGQTFTGCDYLGGCTYTDEAEFTRPGDYYTDMCDRAADDLRATVESAIRRGTVASDVLKSL